MRWTVPNILTVMRLLAAPGVAFAFVIFDRPYADWIAFFLFILAALTDFVDGQDEVWVKPHGGPNSLVLKNYGMSCVED
jgi:hypothetical protein